MESWNLICFFNQKCWLRVLKGKMLRAAEIDERVAPSFIEDHENITKLWDTNYPRLVEHCHL